MSVLHLETPLTAEKAARLRAGDRVLLSGTVWTGRDQAHKRICALLENGEAPPFELRDQIIYFVGPCPAPYGRPIGSAGPTTSGRMDAYSPRLLAAGLRGMIGKGGRSDAVIAAMREHNGVYFAATGGAGALIARRILSCEPVAFPELGPEAVYRLEVKDFPLVVAIDCHGGNLYR